MNSLMTATSKTPFDTFTLSPFTKSDWIGMAGAELFADGGEPFRSNEMDEREDKVAMLVADGAGIAIFMNHNGETYELRLNLEGMHKDFILAIAESIRRDVSHGQLTHRGFKQTL